MRLSLGILFSKFAIYLASKRRERNTILDVQILAVAQ